MCQPCRDQAWLSAVPVNSRAAGLRLNSGSKRFALPGNRQPSGVCQHKTMDDEGRIKREGLRHGTR